jgi:hypothetical protein
MNVSVTAFTPSATVLYTAITVLVNAAHATLAAK